MHQPPGSLINGEEHNSPGPRIFVLARQPFSEKWELGSHGHLRITKSRWNGMTCPISSHLRPAKQVGLHEPVHRVLFTYCGELKIHHFLKISS